MSFQSHSQSISPPGVYGSFVLDDNPPTQVNNFRIRKQLIDYFDYRMHYCPFLMESQSKHSHTPQASVGRVGELYACEELEFVGCVPAKHGGYCNVIVNMVKH